MTHTPPLWKQLLGAGLGALFALILYGVYEVSTPLLLAYIPQELRFATETRMASKEVPDDTKRAFGKIAERARKFAEEAGDEQSINGEEPTVPVPLPALEEVREEHAVTQEEPPPPHKEESPLLKRVSPRRLLGSVSVPTTADVPVKQSSVEVSKAPELSGAGVALWGTICIALGSALLWERKRLWKLLVSRI